MPRLHVLDIPACLSFCYNITNSLVTLLKPCSYTVLSEATKNPALMCVKHSLFLYTVECEVKNVYKFYGCTTGPCVMPSVIFITAPIAKDSFLDY